VLSANALQKHVQMSFGNVKTAIRNLAVVYLPIQINLILGRGPTFSDRYLKTLEEHSLPL
jgi:hypothetical protein